jgi:hypothetical protein
MVKLDPNLGGRWSYAQEVSALSPVSSHNGTIVAAILGHESANNDRVTITNLHVIPDPDAAAGTIDIIWAGITQGNLTAFHTEYNWEPIRIDDANFFDEREAGSSLIWTHNGVGSFWVAACGFHYAEH